VYTTNLAGRPVNGYSYDDSAAPRSVYDPGTGTYPYDRGMGHGIAYGFVNNQIVLFYPFHARVGCSYDGTYVYGPNDSKIGYFATLYDGCAPDERHEVICNGAFNGTGQDGSPNCVGAHDLAYIVLYQGNWPANLNRIYRGSGATPTYWTITDSASNGLTCSNFAGVTRNLNHNFQKDASTSWLYRSGHNYGDSAYGMAWPHGGNASSPHPACTIRTDLSWHNAPGGSINLNGTCNSCPIRDSGSPWVANYNTNTLFAASSSACCSGDTGYNVTVVVTPMAEGLNVLYVWSGSNSGLCKNSTCGGLG
jgi:hypothetical protein